MHLILILIFEVDVGNAETVKGCGRHHKGQLIKAEATTTRQMSWATKWQWGVVKVFTMLALVKIKIASGLSTATIKKHLGRHPYSW